MGPFPASFGAPDRRQCACLFSRRAGAKSKPKRPPFNKTEVLLQWINEYRHNPEPERLAEAYKAMRDLNLLKDVESAGIYVGFLAGVIGADSDKAEKLISDMFP